jgi:ABC-type sugar transport system substrate-binding protein
MTPIVAAVAASLLALGTSSCGSSDGGGSPSGSGGGEGVKIGLAISTLNNPFFVQLKEGAQQAADAAGADLSVQDAQNDASTQANQMQNFATQSVGAIVINPVDSDAAGAMVKTVGTIPVVAVDRGVTGAEVASYISSDNVSGGMQAAETLGKQLGGKGEIAVLEGVAGTSASRDRFAGFEEGMKAYPDIKIVAKQPADFDRAKGLDVTTNILQSNPNITGLFAENDEMALGAIKALGDKAGTSVTVVGFDGTPDGLAEVEKGTLYATIAQLPKELGKKSVEAAIQAAQGQAPKKEIRVEVKVVTKANVAEYK